MRLRLLRNLRIRRNKYGWVLEVKEIPEVSDEEVELKLIEK